MVLVILFAARPPCAAAQSLPEIEHGGKIFSGLCVVCHGADGGGGEAPSLNRPTLDRAPDDDALRSLIVDGIVNRMPANRHLSDTDLRHVVSYVRSLGRTLSAPPVGDPQQGLEVYQRLACSSCHIVKGEGGSFGPELTDVGSMRGAQYLRQSIIDPGAALPRGTLRVPGRDLREFMPVRIVTREGREVLGIRVNEDTLTIQLRDPANQIHSFRKSDLQQIEKQAQKSLMPSSSGRLTAAELDDLVAYLSSLRGAK